MSAALPTGRGVPRWSVEGAEWGSAASIAGLPGSRAMVRVGPPLSASGPSFGSMRLRLVEEVKVGVESELRLWPASVIVPEQLLPEVPPYRSVLTSVAPAVAKAPAVTPGQP